jgi:hypothetical protein
MAEISRPSSYHKTNVSWLLLDQGLVGPSGNVDNLQAIKISGNNHPAPRVGTFNRNQ